MSKLSRSKTNFLKSNVPVGPKMFGRLNAPFRTLLLLLTVASASDVVFPSASNAFQSRSAQDNSEIGAELFPVETTIYLRLERGGDVVERLLNHPLRNPIEALDQVKAGLKSPQFLQFKLGVGLIESQVGEQWLPAIKSLTGGGVNVGFDAKSQVIGIAVKSDDEELLRKTAGAILGFAKTSNKGDKPVFEVSDYHGGKVAKFEKATIARMGAWFLASNNHAELISMADRLHELETSTESKQKSSLASTTPFLDAWQARDIKANGFVFANLQPLRDSGAAKELFAGSTDQPAVELFFGGILEALQEASFVSANISINDQQIAANVRLPYMADESPENREFFFGNMGLGRAPVPIEVPGLIGQVVTYRNLGSWWLSKEELFPENVVAQLAQGDSQLSTLFGGVDFGQDVLGGLHPEMRLLVKEQTFGEGIDPDIKLPAIAIVSRLQNPDSERRFRISFQSLVGLLNLDDSGMDRPQIELVSTREDGYQLTGGQYFPEGDYSGDLFVFNFSPAMAFHDDYMIVSSTMEFAREIAESIRDLDDNTATSDSNTLIQLHGAPIKHALAANRESLIANSMVERGTGRDEAESQIDLLLELLDYAGGAKLDYRIEPDAMQLDLQLKFANPAR